MYLRFTNVVRQISFDEHKKLLASRSYVRDLPDGTKEIVPGDQLAHGISPEFVNAHPEDYQDVSPSLAGVDGALYFKGTVDPRRVITFPPVGRRRIFDPPVRDYWVDFTESLSEFFLGEPVMLAQATPGMSGLPFHTFIMYCTKYNLLVPDAAIQRMHNDFNNVASDNTDEDYFDFAANHYDTTELKNFYLGFRRHLGYAAKAHGSFLIDPS